ncbi:hypothetical protein PENSPDRAFT_595884 [Peniophora sp. CONT]|nr:hypothetical protein PENSPDRAFT_595884 [Peniophora sp. CONT]
MRYVFLPPYSPDLNPIELAFSAIKSYIRRHGEEFRKAMESDDPMDIQLYLNEAIWSVTPETASAWFDNCGY